MSDYVFEDEEVPENWEQNLEELGKQFEASGKPTAEDIAVVIQLQDKCCFFEVCDEALS